MRPCRRAVRGAPAVSFDHLVGGGEQSIENRDFERLCGLQVDDQLERGRLSALDNIFDSQLLSFTATKRRRAFFQFRTEVAHVIDVAQQLLGYLLLDRLRQGRNAFHSPLQRLGHGGSISYDLARKSVPTYVGKKI